LRTADSDQAARPGSSGTMSDNNEGIADSSDNQDHRQDIHWRVVSGMVADLISDRESHSRQHEVPKDLHAPFGKHEVSDDNTYEANHTNKIVYSVHSVGPIFFSRA
jgi:hypothetical protein